MTGLISDDGAVSGTCRQNGRSQDTRQEGWGGGLLVRCVRAETPLFTNRIRSQKNSFLSRTGGFFWVGEGGLRKASFALTPFTRLPEGVMCRHGFVRGVKAKPPIFTNRIRSQKNSLLSRT